LGWALLSGRYLTDRLLAGVAGKAAKDHHELISVDAGFSLQRIRQALDKTLSAKSETRVRVGLASFL
jgi:hypothetical protein